MSVIRPFRAIRPAAGYAEQIASFPYDVMNRSEAKALAAGRPYSFLRVVRSEINFDDSMDPYSDAVYLKAKEVLHDYLEQGALIQDEKPLLYLYRQVMEGRAQTGLVACVSVDEYLSGKIKKHELTREEKEIDRIRHFDTTNANTAPIFLTYRHQARIDALIQDETKKDPVYDFESEDGIRHVAWVIDDEEVIQQLVEAFASLDALYIADGHHRSASAAKVGEKRRKEFPNAGEEAEFNYFMAVIFPDKELYVMDYNRLVADLNGLSKEDFLDAIQEKFYLTPVAEGPYRPKQKATYGMYLDKTWYELKAKDALLQSDDPVQRLDVEILQRNLLSPILGIDDPRTNTRIDFVGGIRGLKELEQRVDNDGWTVAFSFYPTGVQELMAIADADETMPPKSTWFEPKLRSGLFVHSLDS